MRKIATWAAVVAVSLTMGGCATQFGTRIETAWNVITSASVSPTQIVVAANAFDAAQATATSYLLWCKDNAAHNIVVSYCSLSNRKTVVKAVRDGRVLRNQLEPYIVSGGAAPVDIYNALVSLATSIQAQIPEVAR